MSANKFVFVVCGSREHVDTLHFSLRYLKRFSGKEIIVVTDSSRNEIKVEHEHIVDVKTPSQFNHHQASIYLKVGLHKFLPEGNNYCYLDSDVVALSAECDDIFNYQQGPVTFAYDHCSMPEFSHEAVNCNCTREAMEERRQLELMMVKYDPAVIEKDPEYVRKKEETLAKFDAVNSNIFKKLYVSIGCNVMSRFKLDDNTIYDRVNKEWIDKNGRKIFAIDTMEDAILKNSGYRWEPETRRWLKPNGRDVYRFDCNHLQQYIQQTWGTEVDANFHHWNGGVFLFNDRSKHFMDTWFDKTMQIFELPNWRTRDQGTLIATAWQLNAQNAPVLPLRFNLIADGEDSALQVDGDGNFSLDGFATQVKPVFIHIFHSFGKRGWPVWDYVERLIPA